MLTEAVDHEGQIDFPRHVYRSSRAACHPTERWGGSTGGCLLTLPSSYSSPGSFEVWQPGPTWLAHVAAVFTNTVTGWRVPHGPHCRGMPCASPFLACSSRSKMQLWRRPLAPLGLLILRLGNIQSDVLEQGCPQWVKNRNFIAR